ncbi:MAG: MFS transporter [Leptospirales bacterium]|nr:MFS transporter [Leptospirales bacterium]
MENKKKSAYYFILLLGIVSLFSDLTHEGARSILGPYLALLGASAAAIGFVSGLGEFIGYALRIVTGFISDKTKKYWTMAIIGYGINIVAIPLLAFLPENGWVLACGLILAERFGKAIRNPAKSTLVSFAASKVGPGKGFALQEALDQIGAFAGPVILFIILTLKGAGTEKEAYAKCFLALGVTAILALAVLLAAKKIYPHPENFEPDAGDDKKISFNRSFWFYIAAISLVAAGFIDFPLIAFHLADKSIMPSNYIPLLYAFAMGVDAAAALYFGWLYDKKGIKSLMAAVLISAFFAPFIFLLNGKISIVIGMLLWGIGMGAQESILKATVTSLTGKNQRATAFGIFNTGFGAFWFIGSWIMGYVYSFSLPVIVIISMAFQLLSLPLLFKIRNEVK